LLAHHQPANPLLLVVDFAHVFVRQ
jgi:hypothetical protein